MESSFMPLIKLKTLFAMSNSHFAICHTLALIFFMSTIEIVSRSFCISTSNDSCLPCLCLFRSLFFLSFQFSKKSLFNGLKRFDSNYVRTKNVLSIRFHGWPGIKEPLPSSKGECFGFRIKNSEMRYGMDWADNIIINNNHR